MGFMKTRHFSIALLFLHDEIVRGDLRMDLEPVGALAGSLGVDFTVWKRDSRKTL